MNERGFTILETLVVLAVISLTAGIVYPVLAQSKRGARRTQCISQLRQVNLGLSLYVADNNGYDTASPSLGMPPSPVSLIVSGNVAIDLFICRGESIRKTNQLTYTVMFAPEADDNRSPTWASLYRQIGENIVTFSDPNHDFEIVGASSPLKTHRVSAVFFDGHAKTIVKAGDVDSLQFYHVLR